MKRNATLSLDAVLLDRAERLARPGENRTELVERLLAEALRVLEEVELHAQYARAFPTRLRVAGRAQGAVRGRTTT